uniref:STAS domain-containing protein n=1 Tax=Vannella robusta TaxID=1487602 RepID=A0A6U1U0C5_9EUKA|mmetsp:Transcript_17797/g.22623  ORF Transcript_17797/g.22623 Transcript_17797/m.22623 type:complete len:614 (+) Transcript_17797:45-1886(+)
MFNIKDWFKSNSNTFARNQEPDENEGFPEDPGNESDVSDISQPYLKASPGTLPTDPSELERTFYTDKDSLLPNDNDLYARSSKWDCCQQLAPGNLWKTISTFVPAYISVFNWLPNYNKKDLPFDIISGLTVGVMMIPQAIAYAILAGLPPVYGLYTAFVPVLVYSLMGQCKQLSVGPDPLGAILLSGFIPPDTDPVAAASMIAFLTGCFHFMFGLFRFGFLDNIVSVPVLRGFISAVAIQIGVKQLDALMGVPPTAATGWARLEYLFESIPDINWISFTLGAGSLLMFILLRELKKKFPTFIPLKLVPSVLIAVAAAILLSWGLDFDGKGVPVLGEIPSGYPAPKAPNFDLDFMSQLIPAALYMSVVGMVGSLVAVRQFSSYFRYHCDPNKELLTLGTGNICGSFFNCFPAFGALGRSQVAALSGAKTQLVGFITAAIVMITLLFLVQIFYYLPKSIPAAIILDAAISLLDVADLWFLWKIRAFFDLALLASIFTFTLLFGSQVGVLFALSGSILLVVRHSTIPHVSILGRMPGTTRFKDVRNFPQASVTPGVLIIRIEETLYFGNIQQVRAMMMQIEKVGFGEGLKQTEDFLSCPLGAVIIDAAYLPKMDAT